MNRKNVLLRGIGFSVGLAAFFLFAGIWGCAGSKENAQQEQPFFQDWRVRAERSKGYSPSPRKREIVFPEMEPSAADKVDALLKSLPKNKITLKMHKTDVTVLLRALVRAVDQNIMINESVTGKISINVHQSPWDQVFLSVLKTQGLAYEWEGDIIRVVTPEDKANHLEQLVADSKIKEKERELEMNSPLLTRVVQIDFGDAGKLKENLEKFLSQKDEGTPIGNIMVDEDTNALIIQAMQRDFKQIVSLIEALDKPTPQILIEAHVVEATSETARQLGIQWGGLARDGNAWIYPGANSSGVIGENVSPGIDPTSGMAINFPSNLTNETNTLGLTLGFALQEVGSQILAVQLSALETEGKLNILSSPSITTLDNQSAFIEAGDEVPFQTVENGEVKIEYKKAVLSLQVTPHVIEGETLKLKVVTSKDELDFTREVLGNPTIVTKKAETNVILFDGQTMVIGGLKKDTKSDQESGVPGLKNIPLLGHLFKGTQKTHKMEEVLIFITPHILGQNIIDAYSGDYQE
jgi:type IV pilus assembly protein PilQ